MKRPDAGVPLTPDGDYLSGLASVWADIPFIRFGRRLPDAATDCLPGQGIR